MQHFLANQTCLIFLATQTKKKLTDCAECELLSHGRTANMAKKFQEEIILFILVRRRWRRRYKAQCRKTWTKR